MLSIRRKVLKMKNPDTGEFEGVTAISGTSGGPGESNYDLAVKNGFEGTEEEFLQQFVPENVLTAVQTIRDNMHTHANKIALDSITAENVTVWNDKQDKPVMLSIQLPTTGWVAESDETLTALGIGYRYTHTTTVSAASAVMVSGVVSLTSRTIAQTAGLLDSVGYEANGGGKLTVVFFAEKVPTAEIAVSVQIQR